MKDLFSKNSAVTRVHFLCVPADSFFSVRMMSCASFLNLPSAQNVQCARHQQLSQDTQLPGRR